MVDKDTLIFPTQNIRSLLHEMTLSIDDRLQKLRKDTRYAKVRNSDVKVFMRAFRGSATISEIARSLDVTRQAVHASVQRLIDIKIIELQPVPNNSRDKLVVVTERGRHAQETAIDQIQLIENQMAAVIGQEELKTLRKQLGMIVQAFKQPV